ncbi:MAG: alanine racemase [Planctomycetes bacterium]|nr:alanine racemase [Planctomycetota bacterium]
MSSDEAGTATSARDAALGALGVADGPLTIGGLDAEALAREFGTPLYAYDAGAFRAQIARVQRAFEGCELLFALKANPSLALARIAHASGTGAELASAGEILLAERAGFPGEAMQMAGPGKSKRDLREALRVHATINLESEGEYARLVALARELGVRPRVQIRVHPNAAQDGARLRMADSASRFGVDLERVVDFARAIERDDECTLLGLHAYGGSQAFDVAAWLAACEKLARLGDEVELALGRPLSTLAYGGGFGWPVYDGDPLFDLAGAGRGLRELRSARGDTRRAVIELGRHLCAGCGVYLTRVVDAKDSGGRRQIVLDGGMHHCGAAAGLGAVVRRAYAIVRAAEPRGAPHEPVTLGGPLCTPADRFGKDLRLPPLAVGELVAVLNVGAYGLSFSPSAFLGHPSPAEVLVEAGTARLVRERGEPGDVLRGQL